MYCNNNIKPIDYRELENAHYASSFFAVAGNVLHSNILEYESLRTLQLCNEDYMGLGAIVAGKYLYFLHYMLY